MSAAPLTRREARVNAWLSVALLAGIVVLVNAVASDRLRVRRDLSADQLYAVSPATTRILRGLEERVQVRTYFTRETDLGDVALARARIESQLAEFRAIAGERIEVVEFDPARSSEARDEARAAGVRPTPQTRVSGTQAVSEEIWLGLTLRYRGREQSIPRAEPWRFEVQFASALHALQRDRRVVVGTLGMPETPAPVAGSPDAREWPSFALVQQILKRGREARPVTGLAEGRAVPEDVDVLLVVASNSLHPREVFEIDRFVQRGGSVIVAVDDPVFGVISNQARASQPDPVLSGDFAALLRAWGAVLRPWHVWDTTWATEHPVVRLGPGGQRVGSSVRSPAVITVPREGLAQDVPPTRDLPQVTFWWCHPIEDARLNPPPPGVVRQDLAWTSDGARRFDVLPEIPYSQRTIDQMTRSVVAEKSGSFVLGAAFHGDLPSAYAGRPVPEPRNPLGGGVAAADPPPIPDGVEPGYAVVFGDADWLRDPPGRGLFAAEGGALLLENLVDWLTLDDDLIALRSRVPRERPLVDFEEEEARALGVFDADPFPTEAEQLENRRLLDRARERAARRRWRTMLEPILAALAIVGALGVAWNLRERRAPRSSGGAALDGDGSEA